MNRRTAFRHLAMASAAAWLLPACISDPKKVSVALNRLQVSGDEEELLAAIADTIIPQTDTPGAVAVQAHIFTLVMVDDCMNKGDQEKYLQGMRKFETVLASMTGKNFSEATPDQRLELLTEFESRVAEADEQSVFFYQRTRGFVIQGYESSEYFLTEIKPYQLVPGPNYHGCVPVSTTSNVLS